MSDKRPYPARVIEPTQVRTPVQARLAQVETSVSRAAAEIGAEHPHHGFRAVRDDLAARLALVHDRCQHVEDAVWAAYTTQLDRGLDELQIELTRAVEHPDSGASAADVLFARTTRLELDGWLVRLDVPGAAADHSRAREVASAVSHELADYRATASTGTGASRAGVEQALEELRRAAR
jgi:hypothetical protein